MKFRHTSLSLTAAFALTSVASAQSFYIDFDDASGFNPPSAPLPADYGAAAGVGGAWNAIGTDTNGILGLGPIPLVDTSGNSTAVFLDDDLSDVPFGFTFTEPNATGNDAALLNDFFDPVFDTELEIGGLASGTYQVYTYAMATDISTSSTAVELVGQAGSLQEVGGDFSSGFLQGTTHALHTVTINGGESVTIRLSSGPNSSNPNITCNGIQIVRVGGGIPISTAFCSANANSTGMVGQLVVTGSDMVADNSATLELSSAPPGQFGLFLVAPGNTGNAPLSGGVLCLSGPIGRFGQGIFLVDASGEATLNIDLTQIPGPSSFNTTAPGDTWCFQGWHRDVMSGAPTSNLSTGASVTFN